ncbi:fungal-specific transcription factor domain-containing protein [Aspergillus sergii]|uniref:Fungal-specific transcription factor domain-containing protein n=1 Tax=Aspergillus sergii TaxID=1034303 RepID=A0A5N6XF31_9EURO|nr:fungal-specific transcription factor domain-containing protein [Aspergillus sergii]
MQNLDAVGTSPVSPCRSPGSSVGEGATRKRQPYVHNACLICKSKKLKCSGEDNCARCKALGVECQYPVSRKRSKTIDCMSPGKYGDGVAANTETDRKAQWARTMDRIRNLEDNYAMLQRQLAAAPHAGTASDTPPYSKGDEASPRTDVTFSREPGGETFRGSTSIVTQLNLLSGSISRDSRARIESTAASRAVSPAHDTWSELPRMPETTLTVAERDTRAFSLMEIRQCVDAYFLHLNPLYPCLNENAFRLLLDKFLAGKELSDLSCVDKEQFVALINLMCAEVTMLSNDGTSSERIPAWEMFCRAESILNRLTWLGGGNIMTIQCLLIKARYLLYVERANGAYDTMGRVVRLCWQLGLQHQPSWSGLSMFDVIMRQRTFWTAFYLDHLVALVAGAPYLIRKGEVNVDLPANIDDALLFPDQPLPPLTLDGGPLNPYLIAASEWAKLSSDVWDTVCGINARGAIHPELIATMDARIRFKEREMPPELRWTNWAYRLNDESHFSKQRIRQSAIFSQRMNLLRLLIRQESMLSLNFDYQMADDCNAIALSNINAIYDIHYSPVYNPLDRFAMCEWLTASLIPLICIIVKLDGDIACRIRAIEPYRKAVDLLRTMASQFITAKHALSRIHKLTRAADKCIRQLEYPDEPPLYSEKAYSLDTIMPQLAGFMDGTDPQQEWGTGYLNPDLEGRFHFTLDGSLGLCDTEQG